MTAIHSSVHEVKRVLRWALGVGVAIGGTWLCAGCGAYAVTATDGTIFRTSETMPDPTPAALRSSAAHDLPCESNGVDIRRLDPERAYAVTGCGRSLLYGVLTPTPMSWRVQLLSRSPSPPGGDHSASLANQPGAVPRGG
jgi:hypothetical protein